MTDEPTSGAAPDGDCAGCPLVDRRDFLRGALLAIGATAAFANSARALPLITGTLRSRAEKAYPIPTADGVRIDKDLDVILSRTEGRVYAFNLACPHQNTALRWDQGKTRFQCPKHKSIYTPAGVFVDGRATRGLDRFAVRREGPEVVVNLDLLYQEDEDPEKWRNAVVIL